MWPIARPASLTDTGERTDPNALGAYAFKRIYSHVAERFGDLNADALDYGCGSGYGAGLLAKTFGTVTGIDVDKAAIDYCRRCYGASNLRFLTFDPCRQPFPDLSFDRIFSFQVFEHVPLDMTHRYIEFIWNMLRPGGVAIITTPKAENYYGGHSGNPFHVKEYTLSELEGEMSAVLPHQSYRVLVVVDVFSTRLRNRIRRAGRAKLAPSILASVMAYPVVLLERCGVMPCGHADMLTEATGAEIMGSYYVEVKKPKEVKVADDVGEDERDAVNCGVLFLSARPPACA